LFFLAMMFIFVIFKLDIYIHIYMYICMYTYMYVYIHLCMYTYMYVYLSTQLSLTLPQFPTRSSNVFSLYQVPCVFY
jgi:hypothetical protein